MPQDNHTTKQSAHECTHAQRLEQFRCFVDTIEKLKRKEQITFREREIEKMAATTKAKSEKEEIHLVDIVRTGEKMILPENMTLAQCIKTLQHQERYEEQETAVNARIPCFLFEGAWALYQACSEIFGWVENVPTPGWFGDDPPMMLSVPISRTQTVQVPWGRIRLPVLEGYIETGTGLDQGRLVFLIGGVVKRKHEAVVNKLIERTRELVRSSSIYKGKAFRIRFRDNSGKPLPMPTPTFVNLDNAAHPSQLIFRREVYRQIDTNIFSMIARTEEVKALGVPLKRGILLSGHYGTGKTLVVTATARLAEENGWTFIECERADEIADVVRVAQGYGRTVVFCEDIDQVLSGDRSINMNDILNVVDGLDAKSSEIMVVLTTNHVEDINQAMIRPGRIDEVIEMLTPDPEAVERLIRLYGTSLIPENENLLPVCEMLEGQIPSLIRDVVEKAKLYGLSLTKPGQRLQVGLEALLDAAQSKRRQIDLLREKVPDNRTDRERAAETIKSGLTGLADALGQIAAPREGHRDGHHQAALTG